VALTFGLTLLPLTFATRGFLPLLFASSAGVGEDRGETHKLLSKEVSYNGSWRQIVTKKLKLPNGKVFDFDVVSNNALGSVTVFPWDVQSKTCTLIKEYHPGPEKVMYGLPAGQFEPQRHETHLHCAKAELSEEAALEARDDESFVHLLEDDDTTVPLDKYTDNTFNAYLCLNPRKQQNPAAADDQEYIVVEEQVTYAQVMALIRQGRINIPSSYTILLAFRKMEELGIDYK